MKQVNHIQVIHLHPENSSRRQRRGSKYFTIAIAYDDAKNEIARAFSQCSAEDIPDKKMGYELAVGRVVKKIQRMPVVIH